MDDFVISNLQESRNEWCSRLVSIFTPLVEEGLKSIFEESWKICVDQDEMNKYLMTFQNLLSRIPKWNSNIIEDERKRIIERSGCNYLEDLITCVHIIQLKVLYDMTKSSIFNKTALLWEDYSNKKLNIYKSTFIKILFKIFYY